MMFSLGNLKVAIVLEKGPTRRSRLYDKNLSKVSSYLEIGCETLVGQRYYFLCLGSFNAALCWKVKVPEAPVSLESNVLLFKRKF